MSSANSSAAPSPPDEGIDDDTPNQTGSETLIDSIPTGYTDAQSPGEGPVTPRSPTKTSAPLQKRRRVTRACDECRRKKIKCDGKQPCTHCTVYSYDCTYDQPSNRRRNPAPQYIEALESRLHKAELIIRTVLPSLDLDDPKFDAHSIEQIISSAKSNSNAAPTTMRQGKSQPPPIPGDDGQLESMVDNTASLDLDDRGNWDYHGTSSGLSFMRRLKAQFGDIALPDPRVQPFTRNPSLSQVLESPKSASDSPLDPNATHLIDLPPRDNARELCANTLDDCCALLRFVHKPSFYEKFDRIYDTDPDSYTNADIKFLPLLYMAIALGSLYNQRHKDSSDERGFEGVFEQGYHYFSLTRALVDITDCRDITALQTIIFMVLFLQSTAKLGTCYSHVGVAQRAAVRMGLHRNVTANFVDPIERESRKRVFWTIRNLDIYVSAMLGLPQMLSDKDIDQELPTEVDDDFITKDGILPQPADRFAIIRAFNAHSRLASILKKVVKYIYPSKTCEGAQGQRTMISHAKIQELERDLQNWMDELPKELRPSEDAPRLLGRVQQHLRMSFAHVQLLIYRPFLHYVSSGFESRGIDKRMFACAAVCVSVSRNVVHITSEMKRRGLLVGAYWFQSYTSFIAILSLCFFVLENPNSTTGQATLKDALEGKETLASLAKQSPAADRVSRTLAPLFDRLPEQLRDRKNSAATPNRKRQVSQRDGSSTPAVRSTPNVSSTTRANNATEPRRASTSPSHPATASKRFSGEFVQSPSVSQSQSNYHSEDHMWRHSANNAAPGSVTSMPFQGEPNAPSPQQATFSQTSNSNIPDLKNVMFPSDNPFAYGNQTFPALEGGQQEFASQPGFTPGNMFIPNADRVNPGINFEGMYNPGVSYMNRSTQQINSPVGNSGYGSISQVDSTLASPNVGSMPAMSEGEYWQQLNNAGRTGFTPGINPSVNFDDLFGNEQWNTAWIDGLARQ